MKPEYRKIIADHECAQARCEVLGSRVPQQTVCTPEAPCLCCRIAVAMAEADRRHPIALNAICDRFEAELNDA